MNLLKLLILFVFRYKLRSFLVFKARFSVRQDDILGWSGRGNRLVRTRQKLGTDESHENFRNKAKKKAPSAVTLETFDHLKGLKPAGF